MDQRHCTSKNLSLRLCESKVKQESEFYIWVSKFEMNKGHWEIHQGKPDNTEQWEYYSAFIASELLELLPPNIRVSRLSDGNYNTEDDGIFDYPAGTAADSLASMLLHLISKGLIDPKGI